MTRKAKYKPSPEDVLLPFEVCVPDAPPGVSRARPVDRDEKFFGSKRTPASQAKSQIVVDTFMGWASVMLTQNPVALWYFDLYCGKGIYGDGSPSTPIELFEKVVAHGELPGLLRMNFNDRRDKFVYELRQRLMAHAKFAAMAHPPQFRHGEVDEGMVAALRAQRPRPFTFAFIDPFGYKGLTRDLIDVLLGDFGCDVMFFFSYHAIKRVLSNPSVMLRSHVEALLGVEAVRGLCERFADGGDERENERAVLAALGVSMKAIDGQDVLPFTFRRRTGHASHHLVFVSKHVKGFQVAKDAMAHASSWFHDDEIPSLEYIPEGYDHRLRIDPDPPSIEKLKAMLVHRLSGKNVSVKSAYEKVVLNTPYVGKNVRRALVSLVKDHSAVLTSNGQPAKLRGSLLPREARIVIPRTLRIPPKPSP